MEEIARLATRDKLRDYLLSEDVAAKLVLGSGLEGDDGIFELYEPGPRPEDARVVSRALVNRCTGVVSVEVFLPKR